MLMTAAYDVIEGNLNVCLYNISIMTQYSFNCETNMYLVIMSFQLKQNRTATAGLLFQASSRHSRRCANQCQF